MRVGRDARSCVASVLSPPGRAEAEAGSGPAPPHGRPDGRRTAGRRGGWGGWGGAGQIRASERASGRAGGATDGSNQSSLHGTGMFEIIPA